MTAVLMDGKALAAEITERLRAQVDRMKSDGVMPTLATVLVGDDPASRVYVSRKHRAAEAIGIGLRNYTLPENTAEGDLASLIESLNADGAVNGILLQLPLPSHLEQRRATEKIEPNKDVDGLTVTNAGRLVYGESDLIPCTPRGVMELLHHYRITVESAQVVIVNRSMLVGKPLHHLLLNEDATVTVCHSKSSDLSSFTRDADILITAVGRRPEFVVTADMVKDGAVVVDVAMNRVEGKLVGDVDFEGVSKKASYITPVPGGVGPMTVAMLMQNTLVATMKQKRALVSPVAHQ